MALSQLESILPRRKDYHVDVSCKLLCMLSKLRLRVFYKNLKSFDNGPNYEIELLVRKVGAAFAYIS